MKLQIVSTKPPVAAMKGVKTKCTYIGADPTFYQDHEAGDIYQDYEAEDK